MATDAETISAKADEVDPDSGNGNRTRKPVELSRAEELYRPCDPEALGFDTTDDLDGSTAVVGQARAVDSVRFGMGMDSDGFNIFALGPEETDKRGIVRHFLEEKSAGEPAPADLCYLNNFQDSNQPRALRLPPGTGRKLAEVLDQFAEELPSALLSAFEGEEYQSRLQGEQEATAQEEQEAVEALQERAREKNLALLRTPAGFVFTPTKDEEPVPAEALEGLSEEERESLKTDIEAMQEELQAIIRRLPRAKRDLRERIRTLDREIARSSARDLLEEAREVFSDREEVLAHLDAIEEDVSENVGLLRALQAGSQGGEDGPGGGLPGSSGPGIPSEALSRHPIFRRYKANLAVDHGESAHAPVVYLDHPTYQNLAGWVEYQPFQGALVTDFNLIRPGALHRANGGYLLLDAQRILLQPLAWEGLKRALQSKELRIESPRQMLGMVSTVTLEPEPVPLNVKVVLLGASYLYYLLAAHDPDFPELFKVEADFDDQMERTVESEVLYASHIAAEIKKAGLKPFSKEAVARVIEHSARMASDNEKLSVRTRGIIDILREGDYWARQEGRNSVGPEDVDEAIRQRIYRASRVRDRIQDEIHRETIFIDTAGAKTGQVNGLSVLQLGDYAFGRPSRITARVRLGGGEVVDIEREVELSGPIHSKGVLILSGFLGGRYAPDHPLSLSASLVFEQSYGGVDGDSASSAELYALLSALADIPLSQAIAVTGSVNQRGEIQPVGGVNEKVEGFFDVCHRRGLTGEQGVLLPASNTRHLMLRRDVVEAVVAGRFHLWPVKTVDEGMEILTGLPMGERVNGSFPEGTVNARVERALIDLAEKRKGFAAHKEGEV